MKITKAIIPAAGLGTRVLPASKAVPKEMLNKMMENLSNEEYQLLYDALK